MNINTNSPGPGSRQSKGRWFEVYEAVERDDGWVEVSGLDSRSARSLSGCCRARNYVVSQRRQEGDAVSVFVKVRP